MSVAGAVLREDGRALAIQRADNGAWKPPGGIDVVMEHLSGVYKNLNRGIVALVFRCRASGGRPHTSDEAKAVAWLTAAEVEQSMSEAYAVRILDALNEDRPPVRTHDGLRLITPV